MVRIRRSHRRGRGSIPRLGTSFFKNFWRETKADECSALCKYFPDTRAIFRPSALVSPSKTRETPNNWLGALFSSIGIRTLKKQITIFHQTSIAARLAQSVEHQTFNLRVKGSSPLSGYAHFFPTVFLFVCSALPVD